VFAAAAQRGLPSFEVIYVDSASSDGTCELVAERYRERVRIARLTGTMNAAIARNVGAEVATGETLMFLDGDMELDPDFLKAALDPEYRPLHPLMSGQLPEKF